MIQLKNLKKIVINLDRRQDRLDHFNNEMSWMGWNYERFSAIDTGSYIGCALSHQALAKRCLDSSEDYFMFLEDDIFFMPYAKDQIAKCENDLHSLDFDFFHLAPSLHRPINNLTDNLLDISSLPPKNPDKHREVFGTSAFVLNKRACEYILNWDTNKYIQNTHQQKPIDEFLALAVYPNIKCVASSLPIVTQIDDYSDINKGFYNNHYLMTYNWNLYTSNILDSQMLDLNYCKSQKKYNDRY